MIKSKYKVHELLYGFAAVVYAMVLARFTWNLMGTAHPPILRNIVFYLIGMGLLLLLLRFKRIAAGLIVVLLLAFWLTRPDGTPGKELSILWRIAREVYQSYEWGLMLNVYKGAMPLSFWWVLATTALLLSFVLVYLLPFPPVSLLLLVAPLFFIPDLKQHPHWLFWLFAGLSAITVSLYRPYAKHKPGWPHPAVVTGLIVAVFLLQQQIAPEQMFSESFSRTINRYYETQTGQVHGSFSLELTGYIPDTGILGGPVTLTDRPILDVSGLFYPYYLRGSVYEEFRGDRWLLADLKNNQVIGNSRAEDYAPYADPTRQITREHLQLLQANGVTHDYILGQRPRVENLQTVFSPGYIYDIRTPVVAEGPEEEKVYRFTPEGMFFAEEAIVEGVHMYATVFNMRALNGLYPASMGLQPVWTEPKYTYRDIVREKDPDLYTLVYEQLASVRETNDLSLFDENLQLIKNHFQMYYPYTLTPNPVPADSDLLSYFLETKEGYCVYYASLTTVLLQDIGVSARYAEGFVAHESQEEEIITITGRAGHAWTEIAYEDAGWIMYDTTPTAQLDHLASIYSEPPEESTDIPPEEIDPDRTREDTEERPATETAETTENKKEEPYPLRIFITEHRRKLLVLAAVFSWLFWRRHVYHARHNREWLRAHYSHRPEVLVERVWKDLQALGKLENTPTGTGTVRDTILLLAKTYSVRETERVSAAISLVESTLYGERKPAYEKVEPLLHFHNTIENRIRTYMHPVAWYLKRWLWSRSNPL